jgi:hypothetical protein
MSVAQREDYVRDALFAILEEWSKVKNNFKLIIRELKTQSVSESQFRDILATTISALQGVVHDSNSKIQLLASRIGENRCASDGGSLTCWDTIKQLQTEMETVQESLPVTDVLLVKLQQSNDGTEVRLEKLGQSFGNMATHYRSTIANINKQLVWLS